MKIKALKLSNFRGYKTETIIDFEDLTAFVGKNDAGKSTVLEALDIFFNEGKGGIKFDKTDVNIYASKDNDLETIIAVVFSELPDTIVIDSNVKTSLADEYMLNIDRNLEIVKKYNNAGKPKVFIKAYHPTCSNCCGLLLKKNADLKKIIQANNINCDNQSINSVMRRAIWNHFSDRLIMQEIEIEVSNVDEKVIWDQISSYLPVFSLFQSDRKNSDGDSEVQDPLKEAIKQILSDKDIQDSLQSVASKVKDKLLEVANRTLEKLKEMAPNVAESLNPNIPSVQDLKWQDVFKGVSISGDEGIPINKRGSGVKRLILLNFFRAEVERRLEENASKGVIYAIEEPETSQHCDNQVKLIEALKKLASMQNVQVIITTHSSVIVKQLDYSNLKLIMNTENGKLVQEVNEAQLSCPSLNEVNYLGFGEVTEEYHDELYALIETKELMEEYKKDKQTMKYIRKEKNGTIRQQQIVLTQYIRHQIHHPENELNTRYNKEQLELSINDMRKFIIKKKEK